MSSTASIRPEPPCIRPTVAGVFPELLPGQLRSFYGPVALGEGTVLTVGAMRLGDGLFVGVVGFGANVLRGLVNAWDVEVMLGVSGDNARNLADFLNDQTGRRDASRQGVYRREHCLVGEDEDGEGF